MAFLIKNNKNRAATASETGSATIMQQIHVMRPAAVVAQTTTQQIFRVYGGEILIHKIYAKVTVIMSATDAQLSILSKALSNAAAAVGTALTLSSVAATSANKEVGSFLFIEGDGTAAIWSTAGGAFVGSQFGQMIVPQGEIYESAAASSTTGSLEWHIHYQPLSEGAYVAAVAPTVAAI